MAENKAQVHFEEDKEILKQFRLRLLMNNTHLSAFFRAIIRSYLAQSNKEGMRGGE